MKKLLLLTVLTLSFWSCENDQVNDSEPTNANAKVLGEWELYRDETYLNKFGNKGYEQQLFRQVITDYNYHRCGSHLCIPAGAKA